MISLTYSVYYSEFVRALLTFPKPVVAAVNGQAVGFGVGILPLCDIVYASDKAMLHTPYTQLGQVPEAGLSCTLSQIIGSALVSTELASIECLKFLTFTHNYLMIILLGPGCAFITKLSLQVSCSLLPVKLKICFSYNTQCITKLTKICQFELLFAPRLFWQLIKLTNEFDLQSFVETEQRSAIISSIIILSFRPMRC